MVVEPVAGEVDGAADAGDAAGAVDAGAAAGVEGVVEVVEGEVAGLVASDAWAADGVGVTGPGEEGAEPSVDVNFA